jgi:hypothetical protein
MTKEQKFMDFLHMMTFSPVLDSNTASTNIKKGARYIRAFLLQNI